MQRAPGLPPVRNLPHWSRVGRLGRPPSPSRLPATHHLAPLPAPPAADRGVARTGEGTETRVVTLQNDINFLQQLHKQTLENLHAEVDLLRRQNKELQYRLIMGLPTSSRKVSPHGGRSSRPPTQVHNDVHHEDTRVAQDQTLHTAQSSEVVGSSQETHDSEPKVAQIASIHPLRIYSSDSQTPRAPTLKECEIIIRQLSNANSEQSEEILRIKSLLRDVVFSRRITPENYILTKAYLTDSSCKAPEVGKLPKLGQHIFPEKTFVSSQASTILPALKHSLSSSIADRQRRTRIMQRNHLKRTVQRHGQDNHGVRHTHSEELA